MSSIGKRIQLLRENLDLTQEQFAEKINMSRSALANYECGARKPDLDTLKKIADALHTTTDYLISGKNNAKIEIQPEALKEFKELKEELAKLSDRVAEWMEKYTVNNVE